MRVPDYTGRGLVNLVAHVESMLGSTPPSPHLHDDLAAVIPPGDSVVFLLIDGLGYDMVAAQPESSPLRDALRGKLDTSFSTQTSVVTATLATGLPPSQHGLIGYLLDLPETEGVVNTLWWMRTDGPPIDLHLPGFLPAPNIAERLAGAGSRAVVVEPAGLIDGPFDQVLYRGATTVGVADMDDSVQAIVAAAQEPGTLVLGYFPYVDAAGHTEGPGSGAHQEAIAAAGEVWSQLSAALDPTVPIIGTADHGMIAAREWVEVETPEGVRLGGDSRVLFLHGDASQTRQLAESLPGTRVSGQDALDLWGPGPRHPEFDQRLPNHLVFAPDNTVFHHDGNPMRLAGYHGGTTAAELEIPLLVR